MRTAAQAAQDANHDRHGRFAETVHAEADVDLGPVDSSSGLFEDVPEAARGYVHAATDRQALATIFDSDHAEAVTRGFRNGKLEWVEVESVHGGTAYVLKAGDPEFREIAVASLLPRPSEPQVVTVHRDEFQRAMNALSDKDVARSAEALGRAVEADRVAELARMRQLRAESIDLATDRDADGILVTEATLRDEQGQVLETVTAGANEDNAFLGHLEGIIEDNPAAESGLLSLSFDAGDEVAGRAEELGRDFSSAMSAQPTPPAAPPIAPRTVQEPSVASIERPISTAPAAMPAHPQPAVSAPVEPQPVQKPKSRRGRAILVRSAKSMGRWFVRRVVRLQIMRLFR